MKKFVASAVIILFLGGLMGSGAYVLINSGARARLKVFFATLYDRALYAGRADHISSSQDSNVRAVVPYTSINVESIRTIRALLMDRHFEKLNALLENYEKTLGGKDDLIDVYNAFWLSDPRTEGIFSEWVDKFPTKYEPYLARGAYYVNMGIVSRGTKYASDTTKEQFENMKKYFSLGKRDIDKVLKMKTGIVVPYYILLRTCRAGGDMSEDEGLRILEKGLAINPASFKLRAYYILGITPRWGGSYKQMETFASRAQSHAANNPKIAVLIGYACYDAGDMRIINHDYATALALLNKAMTYGKDPLFLEDRATALIHLKKPAKALKDIDLAIALFPDDAEEYFIRSELLGTQGRLKESLRDMETADAIDTDKPADKGYKRWVSDKLVYSGYDLEKKKDLAGAMGRFNLAVRIDPDDEVAYYGRATGYVNENNLNAAYKDLQKAIELKPDFFYAYYYLDNYVLSRRRDWPDIISHWDKYIALHPEDSRAYVQRSGTYYDDHNLVAAVKDAKRAADLGNARGKMLYEVFKNKMNRANPKP